MMRLIICVARGLIEVMIESDVKKILERTAQSYRTIAPQFSYSREKSWADSNLLASYVNDGDSVLDVGCGNGRLLQSLGDKSIRYVGMDSNPAFIAIAHSRFPKQRFVLGEMTALSSAEELSGKTFNAIFCIAALHHLPSEQLRLEALRQMRLLLAPGGRLLMTNWNLFRPTLREKSFWRYAFKRIGTNNEEWMQNVGLPKNAFGWRDLVTYWRKESSDQLLYYYTFRAGDVARLCREVGLYRVESWYSAHGKQAHWWNGHNILTIAYA